MKKVIVIVGPTGVGKTKLSIELAKKFNTEIISGDSVQVYRYMDIGSAKVTSSEMEGITHHLIDIVEPSDNYSVYDYQKNVRNQIDELSEKNKMPIIVGGTGLYIKSVLYDYEFSKSSTEDDTVLEKFNNYSNEELHGYLKAIDLESAQEIHPNNRKRVLRAIKIFLETGQKKSQQIEQQEHKMLYDAYIIGLTMDREQLYERINKRVDLMVDEGLLDEVTNLYKNNLLSEQAAQSIGYKEIISYLESEITLEEAIELVKRNSRRYAKRQFTWFNNQMDVNWYNVNPDKFNELVEQIKIDIDNFTK